MALQGLSKKGATFSLQFSDQDIPSKSSRRLYSCWVEADPRLSWTSLKKSCAVFPIRKGDSPLPKVYTLWRNEVSFLRFLWTWQFSSGQGSSRTCKSKEFSEDDDTAESPAIPKTTSPMKLKQGKKALCIWWHQMRIREYIII